MKFHTATECAKHHIRELLQDGQGHRPVEVTDYVMEKAAGLDFNGHPMTPQTVTSALYYMSMLTKEIDRPCRGLYSLSSEPQATDAFTWQINALGKAARVLDKAVRDFTDCFGVNPGCISMGHTDLSDIGEYGKRAREALIAARDEALLRLQSLERDAPVHAPEPEQAEPEIQMNM